MHNNMQSLASSGLVTAQGARSASAQIARVGVAGCVVLAGVCVATLIARNVGQKLTESSVAKGEPARISLNSPAAIASHTGR